MTPCLHSSSVVSGSLEVMHLLNLYNGMLNRPCLLLANFKRYRLLSHFVGYSVNFFIVFAKQFGNSTSLSVTIAQKFLLSVAHSRSSIAVEGLIDSAAFWRTLRHRGTTRQVLVRCVLTYLRIWVSKKLLLWQLRLEGRDGSLVFLMLVVGQLGTWSLEHWRDHTTRSLLRLGGYLKLCLRLHILLYWAAWPFSLGSSVFESFWRATKTKRRSLRIQSRASLGSLLGFLFIQSIWGHRRIDWFIICIKTINALCWSHVWVVCP